MLKTPLRVKVKAITLKMKSKLTRSLYHLNFRLLKSKMEAYKTIRQISPAQILKFNRVIILK